MKVLFDSRIFDNQRYGGVSRYFSELFRYFNSRSDLTYVLPLRDTRNEYLKTLAPFSKMDLRRRIFLPRLDFKWQRLFSKLYDLADRRSNINQIKRELRAQNFDIFHPTYYSTYFLKYLKNKPFVVTVYDLIHEIYPEYFRLDHGKTLRQKRTLLPRAAKIIAISENTKRDLIKFYNIPAAKIQVIYLANSLRPVAAKPTTAPDWPTRYLLFVGSRSGYKNFINFIRSISPLLRSDRGLQVVVAGGYSGRQEFSPAEKRLFTELNIADQIRQYAASDEVLAYLYQQAICFVFPTLYEGFGLPVLEAFACGCPAVISNSSSLPEVGGSAARYFDPTDQASILQAVKTVLADEGLRQDMIARGREQLKKFSWDQTGQATLELYASVLDKS